MVTPAQIYRLKIGLLLALLLGTVIWMISMGRIPQNPAYHQFADQRTLLGVPHFWNVVSNFIFVLVGVMGLRFLSGQNWEPSFAESWERKVFLVLFLGCFLTGFGSGYYHYGPENETLFWDRLPLTFVFATFLVSIFIDRIGPLAGKRLFLPTVFLCAFSIIQWHWSEVNGRGDLRLYWLVQFFPMAAIPLMLLIFEPRYTRGGGLWLVLAAYGTAKLTENFDRQVFEFTGLMLSGHTIKHLSAGLGAWLILLTLKRRRPVAPSDQAQREVV